MLITDVTTFLVSAGRQNWLFVKVLTDEGIYGWGEASVEGQTPAVEQCIKTLARRSVIGEDPRYIGKIWQKMYRHGFWKGGFIHMSAISGIDQALWDINGKIRGVPVYMLLGGAVRDRILAYTHAGDAESAKKAISIGFAGIKTGGGSSADGLYDPYKYLSGFDRRLGEIREAIGHDKYISIDNHGQSPPNMAIKQILTAQHHDILFYEEPVPPENMLAYKQIRDAVPNMTIAAGERLFSRYDFRETVQQRLIDIAQPDICHCGGITEIMKIDALAETFQIKLAPHNPNGPVATAASLQVSAASQNFLILEFAAGSVYARQDIYSGISLKPEDGYFEIPKGPGLGIELDEEVMIKYPYEFIQYDPVYHVDGTVGEI